MKVNFFKNIFLYCFADILEQSIEIWDFFGKTLVEFMAIEFLKKIILDILIFNFSFWLSIVSKEKKKKKRLVGILLTGASRTEHGPMEARRTDFLTPTVKSASFFSPRIKEGAGDRDCQAVVNLFSHVPSKQ
jgi:hypothetical protein